MSRWKEIKKIFFVLAFAAGLWSLRSLFYRGASTMGNTNLSEQAQEAVAAGQEEALRELMPEGLSLRKGDVNGLQKLYRSKFGLILKEVRQNPDGTFNAVIQGGEATHLQQGALLSPKEQTQYSQQVLQLENQGRSLELNAKDRQQMADFRRGALGQ
jgi:hypothetical protein